MIIKLRFTKQTLRQIELALVNSRTSAKFTTSLDKVHFNRQFHQRQVAAIVVLVNTPHSCRSCCGHNGSQDENAEFSIPKTGQSGNQFLFGDGNQRGTSIFNYEKEH
ncbi:uncharacterized protein A4U43_C08F21430 [Asparagus officinalis]|nr:uncharacterized protein A4U43_C08F21430 [Asparagus officinalis]